MMREIFYSAKSILFRNRAERLMDGEIRFHIEQETRLNIQRGMTPEQARRAALIEFGGAAQTQEQCREAWGAQFFENLWRDIGFAWRTLRKDYGYTLIAILTLALGIGSNTALFSALRSVVLGPLPVRDGDRVVSLAVVDPTNGQKKVRFSFPELRQYRESTKLLERIEELHTMTFTLLGRAEAENVDTGVVPADYFDFLGVQAQYGRTFLKGEDVHGAPPVLVLSYRYFMKSFGGNPSVVGSTVRMNDRVHTIVGVLPPLPEFPQSIDLFMPVTSCPTRGSATFENNRRFSLLLMYGRMKPGVTVEQVRGEFDAMFVGYQAANRDIYPATRTWRGDPSLLRTELSKGARPTLYLLFAITGLVLLIACFSVANLSLARMLKREREIAIRSAIGGTRSRLLQQFLVEGLMVSVTGGLLGLAAASSVLTLLTSFVARFTPRAAEIRMDLPVLLFCFGISILTGTLFCAVPAWRTRVDLVAATKDGSAGSTTGASRQRTRRMLVSAQVAFSFVVLISAGLLLRSFLKLLEVDAGFQTQHVISMQINPNWSRLNGPEKFRQFYETILDRIRSSPGVVAAGIAGIIPLAQSSPFTAAIVIEGHAQGENAPPPVMNLSIAGDGYFEALRTPILGGRTFTAADRPDTLQVVMVNATMAKRRWPGQDPVGRRIRLAGRDPWLTVIGVVGDMRMESLDKTPGELVYFPFSQSPNGTDLVIRTAADPQSAIRDVRGIIHQVDPDQAIAAARTMDDVVSESLAAPKLTTSLLAMLAGLTLIITIAGIGGVAAVSASQRRVEIGVRLALGAMPKRLVGMIVRQEMWMVAAGLAVGLVGAFYVARLLASFLFGTPPTDTLTFALAGSLMLIAAAAACLIPALRAVRIDPVKTLRAE